jgi:hypothetical protein
VEKKKKKKRGGAHIDRLNVLLLLAEGESGELSVKNLLGDDLGGGLANLK